MEENNKILSLLKNLFVTPKSKKTENNNTLIIEKKKEINKKENKKKEINKLNNIIKALKVDLSKAIEKGMFYKMMIKSKIEEDFKNKEIITELKNNVYEFYNLIEDEELKKEYKRIFGL